MAQQGVYNLLPTEEEDTSTPPGDRPVPRNEEGGVQPVTTVNQLVQARTRRIENGKRRLRALLDSFSSRADVARSVSGQVQRELIVFLTDDGREAQEIRAGFNSRELTKLRQLLGLEREPAPPSQRQNQGSEAITGGRGTTSRPTPSTPPVRQPARPVGLSSDAIVQRIRSAVIGLENRLQRDFYGGVTGGPRGSGGFVGLNGPFSGGVTPSTRLQFNLNVAGSVVTEQELADIIDREVNKALRSARVGA